MSVDRHIASMLATHTTRRTVEISGELIARALTVGNCVKSCEVIEGLPPGCRVVDVRLKTGPAARDYESPPFVSVVITFEGNFGEHEHDPVAITIAEPPPGPPT